MNGDCENIENLLLLQKKVKYGVNTQTSLSICGKIFNDRYLAILLTDVLRNKMVDEENIISYINENKDKVLQVLKEYPTYFTRCIHNLK